MKSETSREVWPFGERAVQKARLHLQSQMPREAVHALAEMFGAFGDPTRLKLLCALAQGELCVGDLAMLLEVSPSAVSHQLRGLRALRLVKFRREGKMIYYTLDDDHVQTLLDVGLMHVRESLPQNQNLKFDDS